MTENYVRAFKDALSDVPSFADEDNFQQHAAVPFDFLRLMQRNPPVI